MRTIVELNPYGRHMGIEYSVAVADEGVVAPILRKTDAESRWSMAGERQTGKRAVEAPSQDAETWLRASGIRLVPEDK
jgi:hypothetical protein